MPHRKDAGVETMQSPGREPRINAVIPEPQRSQLPPRDHSVLGGG